MNRMSGFGCTIVAALSVGLLLLILLTIYVVRQPSEQVSKSPPVEVPILPVPTLLHTVAVQTPAQTQAAILPRPTTRPAPTATPEPPYTWQDVAIDEIKAHDLVRGAWIERGDSSTFHLGVSINCAATTEYAREVGDNFVRLVVTLGPDAGRPGIEIGPTRYNYLVIVYCSSNGKELALGGKVDFARRIAW